MLPCRHTKSANITAGKQSSTGGTAFVDTHLKAMGLAAGADADGGVAGVGALEEETHGPCVIVIWPWGQVIQLSEPHLPQRGPIHVKSSSFSAAFRGRGQAVWQYSSSTE